MNPYYNAIAALNAAQTPYVVIGGFALIMHGANRFTPDINVVVDFSGIDRVIASLRRLGLTGDPKYPEAGLANLDTRDAWANSGQRFYKFQDQQLPTFSLDIALNPPLSLAELLADAVTLKLGEEKTKICSVQKLLVMKAKANRAQDKMDLASLELIRRLPAIGSRALTDADIPAGLDLPTAQGVRDFQMLAPDDKLDWLKNMLTAMGHFCILR